MATIPRSGAVRALVEIRNQHGLLVEEEIDDTKAELVVADSGALIYRNGETGVTRTWGPGQWSSTKYTLIKES